MIYVVVGLREVNFPVLRQPSTGKVVAFGLYIPYLAMGFYVIEDTQISLVLIIKVPSNPMWPFLAKQDTERSHSCTASPVDFFVSKKKI